LTLGQGSGGYAQKDIFVAISNIIGSQYTDTLTGDNNANNIVGGSGDDTIEGKGGADVLDGGDGTDTLSYANSPSAVTVNLNVGTCSGGDAQGDTFTNFENLIGSQYNDKLTGDRNANIIKGGNGNDIIQGNGGDDVLYGESGVDTFKITSLSGTARVKDFNTTLHEKLDFSSFSELTSISDLDIENAGTSTQISFLNGEGQIILENVAYDQLTSNNFVFATQASPSWWDINKTKVTVISSVLSGIAAIAGLAYTLYNCRKDGAYCFKKKAVEKITESAVKIAAAKVTVKAIEEMPLKAKAWLFDTHEQEAGADEYSPLAYDFEFSDSVLD